MDIPNKTKFVIHILTGPVTMQCSLDVSSCIPNEDMGVNVKIDNQSNKVVDSLKYVISHNNFFSPDEKINRNNFDIFFDRISVIQQWKLFNALEETILREFAFQSGSFPLKIGQNFLGKVLVCHQEQFLFFPYKQMLTLHYIVTAFACNV